MGILTPKEIVQCGPISNLSNILYLFYLSASFMKILNKITQAMFWTKFNVVCCWHSRVSNSKVNSPILTKFEIVRDFMPVHVICNFHKNPTIKTKQAILRTRSNMEVFGTKGQITPKSIIRSGRNSNSSEIVCLSR